eukprot:401408_1
MKTYVRIIMSYEDNALTLNAEHINQESNNDDSDVDEGTATRKKQQFTRICKSTCCSIMSIIMIGIIVSGVWYGAYDINTNSTTNSVIQCDAISGNHENSGYCECVSRHHDSSGIVYYSWKIIDTCNNNLPCDLYEVFDTHQQSSVDQYAFEIGNVYSCYSNDQCTAIYTG